MNIGVILESFDKSPISTIAYICLYSQSTKNFCLSKFFKDSNTLYLFHITIHIYTVQK